MPNRYATPTNAYEKIGKELIQLLNRPLSEAGNIIRAANQRLKGETIDPVVNENELVAANRLYRACLTANGKVDTALRSYYTLPLKTPEGMDDPDSPEFFPDIVGAAVSLAKWEILSARGDTRNDDDLAEYRDALRYLGIADGEGNGRALGGGGSVISSLDVTDGGSPSPRGARRVQVGRADLTRERRETMSNVEWLGE